MRLRRISRLIGGKRYNTKTGKLLASDEYWDGSSWERSGRNTWLFRTPMGAYFTVTLTQRQGERDEVLPLSVEEAKETYEGLPEQEVSYEEAFPGTQVEDA